MNKARNRVFPLGVRGQIIDKHLERQLRSEDKKIVAYYALFDITVSFGKRRVNNEQGN